MCTMDIQSITINKHDVICVTETHVTNDVIDNEINVTGRVCMYVKCYYNVKL